jgi:hypothetical protein
LEDWQNNTIAGQYAGQTMPEFPYDLEMISPIGLAMKWNEVKNLSNFYAVMSPFAEVDPQVWDHYNLSELSLMIGEAMAIPSKIRRSITEVRAIQERRAQIQAQQQELDAQQQQADVISKLSKVPQGQPQGQRMSA